MARQGDYGVAQAHIAIDHQVRHFGPRGMSKRAMKSPRQNKWLYLAVREILAREWDPIGVHGLGPDDEYDAYVPRVCGLLLNGADAFKIASRLQSWATHAMGLSQADPDHSRQIAQRLRRLIDPDGQAV